ncbi:unnamed protein product [Pleuronectes platessa]|uniref:Uncharacterized protein n=1 Tax=Pleuronectes platessa TaxID=8262 RepID=A0A9N7Y6B0_PLEPL|nr:unnamed protein product [Pleuronectes platessa]
MWWRNTCCFLTAPPVHLALRVDGRAGDLSTGGERAAQMEREREWERAAECDGTNHLHGKGYLTDPPSRKNLSRLQTAERPPAAGFDAPRLPLPYISSTAVKSKASPGVSPSAGETATLEGSLGSN